MWKIVDLYKIYEMNTLVKVFSYGSYARDNAEAEYIAKDMYGSENYDLIMINGEWI